ncbi:hypothetical protein SDC9_94581 [bioreactor metagenome]|uniref:Uncharacterized protein n=1 Tax=bioreactor metagenome TaxID=1076179 RepID=A0A645A3U7_9ZZZZ
MAMTTANKHQAVTSSFAADAIDKIPTGVFVMFLSCSILAITGKAVMLMDMPINKEKGRKAA